MRFGCYGKWYGAVPRGNTHIPLCHLLPQLWGHGKTAQCGGTRRWRFVRPVTTTKPLGNDARATFPTRIVLAR